MRPLLFAGITVLGLLAGCVGPSPIASRSEVAKIMEVEREESRRPDEVRAGRGYSR